MGRALGLVGTIVVMAVGMYVYSTQLKTATAPGGGGHSRGNRERCGREK